MNKIISKALGIAAIAGMSVGGYMLLQKKKPEMLNDMKDMASDAMDKASDFMSDMKN